MDFSNAQGGQTVKQGAELEDLTTQQSEVLGFSALGGDKILQLLPTPFPNDNLPPSCASLLSVASRRGLIAAAGPNALVLTSTHGVRKAFSENAGIAVDDDKVISNFSPDLAIQTSQLRHVAFSSDEDFLVTSAEHGGGLAVYGVDDALQRKDPAIRVATDNTPVRALIPNPADTFAQYFAVVLDTGRLLIVDVNKGQALTVRDQGVTCVAWSLMGKALVAGLEDGTIAQYNHSGKPMATIPRPPGLDASSPVTAIYWLSRDEFFVVHPTTEGDEGPSVNFHLVKSDKARTEFTFQKAPSMIEFFPGMGPPEQRDEPPRYSFTRLKDWEPGLKDMLIVGASNSIDTRLLTNSTVPIVYDQTAFDQFVLVETTDNRRLNFPSLPGEDSPGDAAPIGEALDLSSKDKVVKPIPSDDEYRESKTPLPAYYVLNHAGILCAWWIVYDKSVREGTGYPGLAALSETGADTIKSASPSTTTPQAAPSKSLFGAPSGATSSFASASTGGASFGQPSKPFTSFGKPSQPSQPSSGASPFGTSSFGAPSMPGKSTGPAFGAPSAFGAAGTSGKPSPWAPASQSPTTQPSQNPFASQAGNATGFAKFGAPSKPGTTSPFSSFGSQPGQSPFGGVGQKSAFSGQSPFGAAAQKSAFSSQSPFGGAEQKSGFSGLSRQSSAFNKVSAEPSFGSTVTVGSSLGAGSTLPSWANTPSQQSGSMFGQQGTTSFDSTKTTSTDDAPARERDEATPTPQVPPQQSQGLFGVPTNGFKLTPSFKGDGTAKDDLPKPPAPSTESLFGTSFKSALDSGAKSPATPIKREEEEPQLKDIPSTTPAQPPRPLFGSATPTQAPPTQSKPSIPDDAPLPPDPTTWKPKKGADDDLPPLAGSPGIKVEAPDSDVPSSPLEDDDHDDGFSVEEQEEDDDDDDEDEGDEEEDGEEEEDDEGDAPQAAKPFGSAKPKWSFQDSANQSPHIRPAAPTPPVVKSGASSRSGDLSRPSSTVPHQPLFGQTPKPATTSNLFQQSATPAGFPKPPTTFNAPTHRTHDSLRSPSPVRSVSTSQIGTKRQQMFPTGASLSSSIQQAPKPPTPQPEVSDLSDDEDDRVQEELASEIIPSRTLDKFIAHQDYTGAVKKTGTAAQIEIIYRDMNSMVDTVGLNSRSLKSFIAYHSDTANVDRQDLEDVVDQGEDGPWFEQWCMAQIEDLKHHEDALEKELDEGRVRDVLDKLSKLSRHLRDSSQILTKLNDIRRQLINRKDPERTETLRKAALPKDLADQQKALRAQYAQLLQLLSQAEEAAFLLKSKVTSVNATNGKMAAVPTVDAVKKTINRLIQMTEKKNNDILLLESKLAKLDLSASQRPSSSSSRNPGTPSRSRALARTQSPLPTTPQNGRSRMSVMELNRIAQTPEPDDTPNKGYGLYYTPEGSPEANAPGLGGELVKLANEMEDSDVTQLREIQKRRRAVASVFVEKIGGRGRRVTRVV